MGLYRKKPVEVEARQLDKSDYRGVQDIAKWSGGVDLWGFEIDHAPPGAKLLRITTLEGTMYADDGDWIVRGVKGEFYPCKPDTFEATYEPVDA